MSGNYKHQSPGGCGQFSAQPEFNYSIENRPQLNFDGYQGQSHGFIQKDFLSYTLNPNSVPCNTQRADYPSQNTHADFHLSVQTRPLYQQQFPHIKLPHRERSCTLPGSKNTQPTVFEGYCKASWNRRQVYDSGGVGVPSSEGDPYAGVRKWNELNSQQFLHKNSNNPPPPKIPSTDAKSIFFGPRYARARMPEAHQKTSPPTLQHPPNPRHLLSSSHNRSQRFLEGEGKAEHRFRGQCDSVHMMGGLAASESARIRIFDPTVSNSTPSGPRSRVSAESPISRVGSSGSGISDEYMGFIIPSDPYTFHSVKKSNRMFQNSGADHMKAEATDHSSMAVKDQSIAPICQQPAPGVNSSNSKTGSLGPAQKPMGRDGDGDSGANDEYMGFIIPSDPYTFYPVQESSKKLQNSGADPAKTEASGHSGMAAKGQSIEPICQQPAPGVNSPNSETGSLLGPAQNPIGRDGDGDSGANDEYMGFIIPSDPYTFYPVQESSKRLQNSEADPAKTDVTDYSGMAVKDQVIAPIFQQPVPKVNSSNSKPGSLLGPAQDPMGRDGGSNSGFNDEYMGFIIPSDPYTFHAVQESSKRFRNSGADPTKTEATDHSGMTMKDQVIALICQQSARKVNSLNSKTGSLLGTAQNLMSKDGGGNSGANDEYMGFIIPSDPYTFHPVQDSSKRFRNSEVDPTKTEATDHSGMTMKDQVIALICQQPVPKVNKSNSKTRSLLGPAKNPAGRDGGGNSGANDEYIGFIIPSDPYTLHTVQNSNTKFWKLGTDHGRVQIAEDSGKAPQFRITAPVQQPALKVNSPNLKTATQQADAREDQVHSLPSRKIV